MWYNLTFSQNEEMRWNNVRKHKRMNPLVSPAQLRLEQHWWSWLQKERDLKVAMYISKNFSCFFHDVSLFSPSPPYGGDCGCEGVRLSFNWKVGGYTLQPTWRCVLGQILRVGLANGVWIFVIVSLLEQSALLCINKVWMCEWWLVECKAPLRGRIDWIIPAI